MLGLVLTNLAIHYEPKYDVNVTLSTGSRTRSTAS